MTNETRAPVRDHPRPAALRRPPVLDAPGEQACTRIARLAARLLNAPGALASLVVDGRNVFAAGVGLGASLASRLGDPVVPLPFCDPATTSGAPFVVEDARRPAPAQKDLDLGALGIGAAAVVPVLASAGRALGTLAILDVAPRVFSAEDLAIAQDLAACVAGQVELRATAAEAERESCAAEIARAGAEVGRRVAEAGLERFRDLIHETGAIFWEADPETLRFTFVSRRAEDILGYPVERWVEERDFWTSILHPEDRERALAACTQATRAGGDHELEYRLIARDGRAVCFHDTVYVVLDAEGRPEKLRGVMIDITERRRIEDERARLLARTARHTVELRWLAEAAIAFASSLSLESALRTVTEKTREVVGAHVCSTNVTVGGAGDEPLVAVACSEEYEALRRVTSGAEASGPLPPDKDGALRAAVCGAGRPIRLTREELTQRPALRALLAGGLGRRSPRGWLASPIVTRDGRCLGFIQLADKQGGGDFTEDDENVLLHVAQMASVALENARLYREAQEDAAARERFLSMASHELKTPLTSLKLDIQLLARALERAAGGAGAGEGVSPGRILGRLQVAARKVLQMEHLIANLLDSARVRAGKLELDIEDVDLSALVREVVDRFRDEAGRAGCVLALDVEEVVRGRWDRLRLDQVVTNLLSNALKYGRDKPVVIALHREGGCARLSVTDRGMGISPEDQRALFEPFRRAAAAKDARVGGIGLGLWIVDQIVRALGGSIEIDSRPGEGATFAVTLPMGSGSAE